MRRIEAGIDFGNSFCKATMEEKRELVMISIPNRMQVGKIENKKAKKIELNGNTTYIGVGELNNNILKHTRNYLLEQSLVAICELCQNDNHIVVDLKTGLPPKQLFNDEYLKEFKSNFPLNQKFMFKLDGVSKEVIFNSIEVFAEGYSGFIHVVDDVDTKQDILSIDVGGGTTDTCDYSFDYEDNMFYPNMTDTYTTGVIDFAEIIANEFNALHGADIKQRNIDTLLRHDIDTIEYGNKSYDLNDYLTDLKPTIDDLINKITNRYGKLDKFAIIGLGGGYKTLYRIIKDQISNHIEIDNTTRFYANAIGYLEQ